MKNIKELQRTFTVAPPQDEYAQLVAATAKLIDRSFAATFKMVEKWEPSLLAHMHTECLSKWKALGFKSASHMWWTRRKSMLPKKGAVKS